MRVPTSLQGDTHAPLSGFRIHTRRKMSWQAVTWVLECSESTLGSRLTMLSIASHANREGRNAFPSIDTIAKESLLSRREIIYAIQAMEELGELRVHRGIGRGNPNHYELPLVERWLQKVQSLHQLGETKGARPKIKGANQNTKRCNDLALNSKDSETSSLQPAGLSRAWTIRRRRGFGWTNTAPTCGC